MKKNLMLFAVAAGITTTTFAQKEEKENKMKIDPPAAVKAAFAKQFPGSTAKWEEEQGNYEANFKHKNHEMSALFTPAGTIEESEMEIKTNELPAAVTTYINKHHSGAKIKEAAKITKANGDIYYEAEIKGKDLIFDINGNFLKVAKN